MKGLSIILAALTAGTAPVLPQASSLATAIVQPAQAQRSGQEAVSSVRQVFEKGGYAKFLKGMDDSYRSVKEKGQLDQLIEMRTGSFTELQDWESRAQELQNEKNKELLGAIEDQNKTPFAEKVRSAAANLSNKEQQDAVERLASFRAMAPGTGATDDENRLIDIDLEYEYKALHLDLPGASLAERREKQCVLKMEKLDKMLAASSSFQDASLKNTLETYQGNFDARLAQSWDISDLNFLVNGRQKPANAQEEKVASILTAYQEKFGALTKHYIAEHEKS